MGSAQIACSSSEHDNNNDTQVVLSVYDLTPINNYTYWFGFGIFHSGIEGSFLPEFSFQLILSIFVSLKCFLCFADLVIIFNF